ncbi:tyrosine-type recombinase/integrase [Candidatus Bathyarchaeota archaeon]|nr:tyrosine-type recombinase/integrase [Candidatus Bathyarchaeota archaeon]
MAEAPACPQCGSKRVWKDGLRYLNNGEAVQRYICRSCGYRFSDPNRPRKNLKTHHAINNGRCGSRVLALLEPRGERAMKECAETGDGHAGATAKQNQEIKGKLLEYAWWMKKKGRSEETIKSRVRRLKALAKHCNLLDPESVKEALAKLPLKNSTKAITVSVYSDFLKFLGLKWDPPQYRMEQSIPFIPLEREIDDLIASCNKRIAALLQLLKETGARIGEAAKLKWTDFDIERRTVRISPEKGSNPRIFHISEKLAGMLNSLPRKSEYIFNPNTKALRESFVKQRKKAAAKLNNPRLNQITFHTIRHWKGTIEYHKTKDPWHVKKILGHKSLQSTEIYINIEQALFQEEPDEFHVKATSDPKEIQQLLEVGFEYVCSKDGLLFFRKRK